MAVEAESYIPHELAERLAKQAKNVWQVALLLVLIWPATIVGAPLLVSLGLDAAALPIYKFFSVLCHQQSERSFHLVGYPFAVCARCFGVYFGLFLGFLFYPMFKRPNDVTPPRRIWLVMAIIPIGIDWTLGMFHILENTHTSRVITGLILGAACSIYLIPGFIEIARNRTLKRLADAD